MKNKRNKKASLSLSVNAIVVLVIGITVLGLALGFTKGMFSTLMGKISIPPPDIPATENDPIAFSSSIEINRGRDVELPVNFYNTETSGDWKPIIKCLNGDSLEELNLSVIPEHVNAGESKTFEILLLKENSDDKAILSDPGIHPCRITFCEINPTTNECKTNGMTVSDQITIKVK